MMKKILYLIFVAGLLLAGCNKQLMEGQLSVSPTELNFSGDADTLSVTVTSSGVWALTKTSGTSWCKTSRTNGEGEMTIDVIVKANSPKARATMLEFRSQGCEPVKVFVNQAAGTAADDGSDEEVELVSPDPASGISVDPAYPNADEPCTIIFKPEADNPLYGHAGELYGHFGVVVEGDWMFVPTEWGTTEEKTHFTKVDENHWEFKMEPSIREYFESGETPVTKIALIVRTADGSIKSHEADQFCSVKDDKYQAEEFNPDEVVLKGLPEGVEHGINCNADGSVTFVLYDKDTAGNRHEYCYIVGDWNEWTRVSEGAMAYDPTEGCWWITLDGFDADREYRFQYRLGTGTDTDTYLSDPYTEIVYDQWNDQYIEGVPAFPEGAKALVSAFQINKPEYNWQHSDFVIEDKNDLVIYEMLLRDFSTTQDIAGAMAQLDYIENLGVNAIELMPIQEFDGNLSWGYNPSHWFALDKYYGTRDEYKAFIDECHSRGIAVIVDVVYNHATGAHPWAKAWWDSANNRTTAENPFFNVLPAHPYNVYHDMNHENAMVKEHVKKSLEFLLTEYDIDGFRFDLTKGFTQKQTDPDVIAWGRYDQSRVNILKGYADHIWSVNDNAVVIFEHLADWDEEKVLADYGIQLWRNMNGSYRTSVNGGNGNLSGSYESSRYGGWVSYMESHDEERICYGATEDVSSVTWGICGTLTSWDTKPDITMTADGVFYVAKNVTIAADDMFKIRGNGSWNYAFNYGASSKGYKLPLNTGYTLTLGSGSQDMAVPAAGTYDIWFSPDASMVWLMTAGHARPANPSVTPGGNGGASDSALSVAMRRAGASAAFFLTVPGPKMIWQFGEFGYDYSINHNDRTGEKPVVTDEYMAVPARKALYDTYAKLLKFRRENPRFFDADANFTWTPTASVKKITCTVDGKTFHVVGNFGKSTTTVALPAGQWKDYMNGNASVSGNVSLKEGEFRFLTSF